MSKTLSGIFSLETMWKRSEFEPAYMDAKELYPIGKTKGNKVINKKLYYYQIQQFSWMVCPSKEEWNCLILNRLYFRILKMTIKCENDPIQWPAIARWIAGPIDYHMFCWPIENHDYT